VRSCVSCVRFTPSRQHVRSQAQTCLYCVHRHACARDIALYGIAHREPRILHDMYDCVAQLCLRARRALVFVLGMYVRIDVCLVVYGIVQCELCTCAVSSHMLRAKSIGTEIAKHIAAVLATTRHSEHSRKCVRVCACYVRLRCTTARRCSYFVCPHACARG
jgi:hypothetical protein